MQRFRFRFSFGKRTPLDGQRIALFPFGQRYFFRFFALPVHATPTGLLNDGTFDAERHAATFRRNGRHVFYASFPEGFQHTPGNHIVDNPFLRTKMLCLYLRDEQGVVVGNLRIVHAPA